MMQNNDDYYRVNYWLYIMQGVVNRLTVFPSFRLATLNTLKDINTYCMCDFRECCWSSLLSDKAIHKESERSDSHMLKNIFFKLQMMVRQDQ